MTLLFALARWGFCRVQLQVGVSHALRHEHGPRSPRIRSKSLSHLLLSHAAKLLLELLLRGCLFLKLRWFQARLGAASSGAYGDE